MSASASACICFTAALLAGLACASACSRDSTRTTLPSTAAAASPNAMLLTAAAVYAPTPGTFSSADAVLGSSPPVCATA
jgi:hypothetical protein